MTTTSAPLSGRCLIDTNILLRLAQARSSFPVQHKAIEKLVLRGTRMYMTFQNISEFWNVSTRPSVANGMGLTASETKSRLTLLEDQFELITEDYEIYLEWLDLLVRHHVSGRQVHDARLVAHMRVSGIPALLTSNVADFTRYQHIQLLDPDRMPQA